MELKPDKNIDYYWRDYTGKIPDDALPAGRNEEGKITYIGQTIYDEQNLIPGEIDPTTKTLFYARERKQQTAIRNIKILCARSHENYEWFDTNMMDVRFLTHKHLISGGYSHEYPALIGRTAVEGKVIVGKIVLTPSDDWFAFDVNGEAKYVKSDFQVLSYNSNKPSKVINLRFKSRCGVDVKRKPTPVEVEQDYYWKYYTEKIPDDAIPAGRNKKGKITYIGQTYYDEQTLIPGEIDPTTKTLFYAMGRKQQKAISNIKILCARSHENYEWIDTNMTDVRFLTHKHLISGGYSHEYPALIGRTAIEGKVIVGKIALRASDDWFAFDVDGEAKYVKSDFQVLSYNSNKPSKVINLKFKSDGDYYWKNYTGKVPNDALPGGVDGKGNTTYIGQTLHGNTLIPGEITSTKALFYALGKKQQIAINNIKILCARNAENYEWIDTDITNIRLLTHKHLVLGGKTDAYPTLIGRTKWDGKVIMGKIVLKPFDDWFAFDVDGEAKYVKTDFQVLSYNPSISEYGDTI